MPFQNRQVNPILAQLMQKMSMAGAGQPGQMGQIPQTGPPPMAPPVQPQMTPPPQMGPQMPQQQQPQGLLNGAMGGAGAAMGGPGGMNPAILAMLKQKMGQGAAQPGQTGIPGVGGGGAFDQLMSQFAGGMPKIDFSQYQLPPSFNWMPGGNG